MPCNKLVRFVLQLVFLQVRFLRVGLRRLLFFRSGLSPSHLLFGPPSLLERLLFNPHEGLYFRLFRFGLLGFVLFRFQFLGVGVGVIEVTDADLDSFVSF